MEGQPNYKDIYEKLGKTLERVDKISKKISENGTQHIELAYINLSYTYEEFENLEEFEECKNELDSIKTNNCSYYENSSCDKI